MSTSMVSFSLGPLRPLRGSRSGNLTPSAQANITILPLRPPAIHRTPLATLLRGAHCVRGICTIRRPNALSSLSGRNRRDIERVHTVTFYVLFVMIKTTNKLSNLSHHDSPLSRSEYAPLFQKVFPEPICPAHALKFGGGWCILCMLLLR